MLAHRSGLVRRRDARLLTQVWLAAHTTASGAGMDASTMHVLLGALGVMHEHLAVSDGALAVPLSVGQG